MKSSKSRMNEKQLYPKLTKAFNELKKDWLSLRKVFDSIFREYEDSPNQLYKAKAFLSTELFDPEICPQLQYCFNEDDDEIFPWIEYACEYVNDKHGVMSTIPLEEDSQFTGSVKPKHRQDLEMTLLNIADSIREVQDTMDELSEFYIEELCDVACYPFDVPFNEEDTLWLGVKNGAEICHLITLNSKESHELRVTDVDMINGLKKAVKDIQNGAPAHYNKSKGILMRAPRKYTSMVAANESINRGKNMKKHLEENYSNNDFVVVVPVTNKAYAILNEYYADAHEMSIDGEDCYVLTISLLREFMDYNDIEFESGVDIEVYDASSPYINLDSEPAEINLSEGHLIEDIYATVYDTEEVFEESVRKSGKSLREDDDSYYPSYGKLIRDSVKNNGCTIDNSNVTASYIELDISNGEEKAKIDINIDDVREGKYRRAFTVEILGGESFKIMNSLIHGSKWLSPEDIEDLKVVSSKLDKFCDTATKIALDIIEEIED